LPPQVLYVERILDYNFTRKLLLVEALTHPTYQQNLGTVSYERLEFLGDSILDIICTDYLYRAEGKNYSPGHMHMRKSAMVNAHMLAFLCLRASTDISAQIPRPD
ncbi:ribonuclease III, partial [Dendrothele bispora CBS 962.96]